MKTIKLYTEEEIKRLLKEQIIFDDEDFDKLTPIQLPSDEEIENLVGDGMHDYYKGGFEEGAKWMRDKIQGGNK